MTAPGDPTAPGGPTVSADPTAPGDPAASGHRTVPRGPITPGSADLYRRALTLMPGGVNSPVRAMRSIGRDPIFVARASGSRLIDVDGNEYVDWISSWGPLIHGHAHPEILAAVIEAAGRGTTYGAPTAGEVELAAEVSERMPSVEMLRMTSSGTEATMSAIRLARAATGRDLLLKFSGAYHGHLDGLLAEAGSGLATQGIPASPGVPAAAAAETVIVAWNDPAALEGAIDRYGEHLAAVLAEPIPANMGVVPPDEGFLERLRAAADHTGALLVFDEVITGFRVARGGAQELYGVRPDITVMGKIIGGGLPAAAFGGPRELMERIAPAGDVYQAGTLSGNPVAVAAGLATLRLLDATAYERLAALTDRIAAGLRDAGADAAVPLTVQSAPGLLTPFFSSAARSGGGVRDYAGAGASDRDAYGMFCRALLARGVYPPPSQFEAWFPSLAHTDADIERTLAAARESLAAVAAAAAQ